MSWFRQHHTCPTCDAEIEPEEHEAILGTKSAKIRTLNDRFRKPLTGGRVMMTSAVSALPDGHGSGAIKGLTKSACKPLVPRCRVAAIITCKQLFLIRKVIFPGV
jgi:hypothetical protein